MACSISELLFFITTKIGISVFASGDFQIHIFLLYRRAIFLYFLPRCAVSLLFFLRSCRAVLPGYIYR
jgi:hypothetical protein